jgi:hypothetical protein
MKTLSMAMMSILLVSPVLARDYTLIVVNETKREVITKFYASNIEREGWEENILHGDVIKPGGLFKVNLINGTADTESPCEFDLMIKTKRGGEVVRRGMDVCSTSTWTITDY